MEQRTFNLEGTDNPDKIREIVSKVVEKVDTNHIYLVRLQTNLNWPSPKLSHSFNF